MHCFIFFSVLDELSSYFLCSMLFLLKNLRKKKWNYLVNLALVKWKNLASWDVTLNTHDSFCGIKVSGVKFFLLKLYKIFFLMLWILIGSKILVEISSHERNLCTEAEKVTRGKGYFGSEQNVLFYGFSVIVNVFPVF